MNSSNNRITSKRSPITFRDRPKGKKVFPVTITLTPAQIDYLQKQPNASALIRRVLDDLIASEELNEDKFTAITLNMQLKNLEEKLGALINERLTFYGKNDRHWKQHKGEDGLDYADVVNPQDTSYSWIPKPLDNEDAQIAFRVLMDYDRAINSLEERVAEVKRKILDSKT